MKFIFPQALEFLIRNDKIICLNIKGPKRNQSTNTHKLTYLNTHKHTKAHEKKTYSQILNIKIDVVE